MFKKLSSLALVISCSLFAEQEFQNEFRGKIAGIASPKGEKIFVSIVEVEGEELNCNINGDQPSPFPLTFERGQSHSEEWFELLNLVRRTQEDIQIGYTESADSDCPIEYLTLMQGDGDISTDPLGDGLTRIGQYGNIAQIYTNNLTQTSYTASNHRGADIAAAAFDGYIWEEQIEQNDEDLGSPIARNIWLIEKEEDDNNIKYWLQVKFEQEVDVTGFRVLVNGISVDLGRSPRGVTILTSIDGDQFEEQGSYSLSKAIDQRANLPEKITLKYFRIQVDSNFGDAYIEIDELEVYSD